MRENIDEPTASNCTMLEVEGNPFAVSGDLTSLDKLVKRWCTTGDHVPPALWLKRDTWTSEEAFLLMNGLNPKGTKVRKHHGLYDFAEDKYLDEFEIIATLDGRSINLPIFNAICSALVEAGIRKKDDEPIASFKANCWKALDAIAAMRDVFGSGSHSERNPPVYYLKWATEKGFSGGGIDALRLPVEAEKEERVEASTSDEQEGVREDLKNFLRGYTVNKPFAESDGEAASIEKFAVKAPKCEPAKPIETSGYIPSKVPGKLPNVGVGKLAIKAAWQIECDTQRAASADAVIAILQKWADDGSEPATLVKSVKSKYGVLWQTKNRVEKIYDVDACKKTLETWMNSRA